MNPPRVLVLDDEPSIGRTLGRVLRRAGFDVIACEDPGRACEILRAGGVAAIVCDQRMPGVDGVSLLEWCATEAPATARILLTGHVDAQVAADAINRAGVFRILWKPWSDAEIVEAVRQGAWLSGLTLSDEVTPVVRLDPPVDGSRET